MISEPTFGNGFSFFGKLPQFPDFIKHKAVSDEFSILDNWIQKGIISSKLSFGNSWKEFYDGSQSFEFIFPIESSDKIICGILHPGMDKSGRQFPFIVFTLFRREFFSSFRIGTAPLVLNSFFYKAKQLFLFSLKSQGLNEIVNEFNKAEIRIGSVIAAENVFEEYLSATTLLELINRLKFKSVNEKNNRSNSTETFSMSFCSDDENINFDTGYIIELIRIKMRSQKNIPYIFKTSDQNFKVSLYVYPALPEPTEFPKLISGKVSDLNLKDFISTENLNIILKDLIINKPKVFN
ncbi:MAG TPA: type VI secretion system-associated protein TagF [Ignavibacteriaceae bacterium]|nr:type VI secretion system-associated protein TagF [Ignavibacteriaceae bacterium]